MRKERNPSDWSEARAQIFALYRTLGIEDEALRHGLQKAVTSCSSLRFMTDIEHRRLITVLNLIASHPEIVRDDLLNMLLAMGDALSEAEVQATPLPSFNLEATLNLVNTESEAHPEAYPVTLVIKQGVELLLENQGGKLQPAVFVELHEGQIQVLIWDEMMDVHEDDPKVHILKSLRAEKVAPL